MKEKLYRYIFHQEEFSKSLQNFLILKHLAVFTQNRMLLLTYIYLQYNLAQLCIFIQKGRSTFMFLHRNIGLSVRVRKITCIYSKENPLEVLVRYWLESLPVYTPERIQQRDWLGTGQKAYLYILQRESSGGTGQGLVRKLTCIYSRENTVEGLVRDWLESLPVCTQERIQQRYWLGSGQKAYLYVLKREYSKGTGQGLVRKLTCIDSRENPEEGLVRDWLESLPVYTSERIQQRNWLGTGQNAYL